jgi:hypothetical protein
LQLTNRNGSVIYFPGIFNLSPDYFDRLKQAGIYAIAEVAKAPQFMDEPPDIEIWTMPIRTNARFYSLVTFQQKLLAPPLSRISPTLRSNSI